jgi:hypothetical protein
MKDELYPGGAGVQLPGAIERGGSSEILRTFGHFAPVCLQFHCARSAENYLQNENEFLRTNQSIGKEAVLMALTKV